jgi:ATP-dependent Clp protease ATP-binding subunit ClpC
VLFDEIEKAHPDVMHLLLQILEEGKITDSLGQKIDFRNTIIIMTSNVGAELIKRQTAMGFGTIAGHGSYEAMRDKILDESKRVFKPEFLNRLDDMIVFHQLERNDLVKIVDLEVAKVIGRLRAKDIKVHLDTTAVEFLIDKGYDPTYGARPMRRAVAKYLEDRLAEEFLRGNIKPGATLEAHAAGEQLAFKVTQPEQSEPANGSPLKSRGDAAAHAPAANRVPITSSDLAWCWRRLSFSGLPRSPSPFSAPLACSWLSEICRP